MHPPQLNVSQLKIPVESLTLSLTVQLTRLRLKRFHSSVLKFLQLFLVLILQSSILATLTLTLLSGRLRLRTWLVVSSRTLLSSQVTRRVSHWLLLVQSCNLITLYNRIGCSHAEQPIFFEAVWILFATFVAQDLNAWNDT